LLLQLWVLSRGCGVVLLVVTEKDQITTAVRLNAGKREEEAADIQKRI
jgi:hypothetical protein